MNSALQSTGPYEVRNLQPPIPTHCTGRRIRLDFLVLSQHGVPVEVSETVCAHFEARAQAVICQTSTTDISTEEEKESVCELSDWAWRELNAACGLQHNSVDVLLPFNLSEAPAQLIFRVAIPPALDEAHIPAQVSCLQLSMPIAVRDFRERLVPGGVTYRSARETSMDMIRNERNVARVVHAEHAMIVGADHHLHITASCTEGSTMDVEFNLCDADGFPAQDIQFVVVSSTLPDLVGQELVAGATVKSRCSSLVLHIQVINGKNYRKLSQQEASFVL